MIYALITLYLMGSMGFGFLAYKFDDTFDFGVIVIAVVWPIIIVGVGAFVILNRIIKPRIK